MNVTTILMIIVLIILLYWIFSWIFSKSSTLTRLSDATVNQIILANTLPNNSYSNNYTYSMWIYVNDWNYRFGEPKIILGRLDDNSNPSPSITLGAMENNLNIAVSCYPTNSNSTTPVIHQCNVSNVPLQRWTNILVSVYGRTLDAYLDGKLVRTCVLPGVPKVSSTSNITITPNGGFNGQTSNVQYWETPTNPEQAFNIYSNGYAGSVLANFLNSFGFKITFTSGNSQGSVNL